MTTLALMPGTAIIGARVEHFDLKQPVTADVLAVLEAALERYGVLVFPGQKIEPGALVEFSRAFGYLEVAPTEDGAHPRYPEILIVGNPPGMLISFSPQRPDGDLEWHTDHIHHAHPARASILHALKVPDEGGDTLFSCMFSAYEALSESEQHDYETLRMIHSVDGLRDYLETVGDASPEAVESTLTESSVVWPLVRRHPYSGRKSLYFGSHVTVGIEDWPQPDARAFVERLTVHATQAKFRYRHRWSVGDVVMWDNRRVLHAGAYYDALNSRRLMHRTTIRESTAI